MFSNFQASFLTISLCLHLLLQLHHCQSVEFSQEYVKWAESQLMSRICGEGVTCDMRHQYCDMVMETCRPCTELCRSWDAPDDVAICTKHCPAFLGHLVGSKQAQQSNSQTQSQSTNDQQVKVKDSHCQESAWSLLFVIIFIFLVLAAISSSIIALTVACRMKKHQKTLVTLINKVSTGQNSLAGHVTSLENRFSVEKESKSTKEVKVGQGQACPPPYCSNASQVTSADATLEPLLGSV